MRFQKVDDYIFVAVYYCVFNCHFEVLKMSTSTQMACKELFGTENIYSIFGLPKNSTPNEIRKSYHQLSLTEHPDRVPSAKKEMATARFQVLTKLYDVLMDQKRRDLYDAEGVIADEKSACMPMPTYKITSDHIAACKAKFVGSEQEKEAIRLAYLQKNGNVPFILRRVPFLATEDGTRVKKLLSELITSGQIPKFVDGREIWDSGASVN